MASPTLYQVPIAGPQAQQQLLGGMPVEAALKILGLMGREEAFRLASSSGLPADAFAPQPQPDRRATTASQTEAEMVLEYAAGLGWSSPGAVVQVGAMAVCLG